MPHLRIRSRAAFTRAFLLIAALCLVILSVSRSADAATVESGAHPETAYQYEHSDRLVEASQTSGSGSYHELTHNDHCHAAPDGCAFHSVPASTGLFLSSFTSLPKAQLFELASGLLAAPAFASLTVAPVVPPPRSTS